MPLKGAGLDYHHETSGFYNDSVGKGNSSSVCVCVQKINISSPLIIQTIRMYTYNIHVDCRFTDIFYERGHLISYFSSISVLICHLCNFVR